MNKIKLLTLTYIFASHTISLSLNVPTNIGMRPSSAPFISGDTFRSICIHAFDECETVKAENIKEGDTVFINGDLLEIFFNTVHPKIKFPYVIISHNSDNPAPGKFKKELMDPKILMWFGQNMDIDHHPKFTPIPIGLANAHWSIGNVNLFNKMLTYSNVYPKKTLLLLNFTVENNAKERLPAYNKLKSYKFCQCSEIKPHSEYLLDIIKSKFTLSPLGHGLDCHRTWEALLLGSIPVVKRSTLDPMYKNLPIVIITKWDELTEDFLNQKYAEVTLGIKSNKYQLEKIYFNYWKKLISSYGNLKP